MKFSRSNWLNPASWICAALLLCAKPAGATVLFEDYAGASSVPSNTITAQTYQNLAASATAMANLRAISSNPANAALSGTGTAASGRLAANVDYSDLASNGITANTMTLCNASTSTDSGGLGTLARDSSTAPTGISCTNHIQGRVVYALVRFPTAGLYTFSVADDDETDIDFSSDYTNTNYHGQSGSNPGGAVYDIPSGNAQGYTFNENTYVAFGNVISQSANSCALMRFFWNNQGGRNYARLQWSATSGATTVVAQAIVPASAMFDPSLPASSSGCTGSIQPSTPSITLNKLIGNGRNNAADQFTVKISTGGTTVGQSTTSGTGIGQQATTGAKAVVTGTTYTLNDAMASGSSSSLSAYTTSIACTATIAGVSSAVTVSGSSPNWTVTPALGQQIVCNITNTGPARPLLGISKSANGPWSVGQSGALYTLTVTNSGAAATGTTAPLATVSDVLPSGITPNWTGTLSSSGWNCTFSGQTVTCTRATAIAAGANSSFALPVNVGSAALSASPVVNYASVGGGGDSLTSPPTAGASCAPVDHCTNVSTTVAVAPNVTVAKSFTPASIAGGGTSVLQITINNTAAGAVALTGVGLADNLPSGMTVVTSQPMTTTCSGSVSATNANTTVQLSGASVAANASCTVTVTVTAP